MAASSSSSRACRVVLNGGRDRTLQTLSASRRALSIIAASRSLGASSPSRPTQTSRPTCSTLARGRRDLHTLPPLPSQISHPEIGCRPFLAPGAVELIGRTWQGGLLDRLNEQVKGTEFENASLVETVMGTAQNRSMALAFNYASLALNNAFFLSNLGPKTDVAASTPRPAYTPSTTSSANASLAGSIDRDFKSLASFKSDFSAAAMGMSGSGWVWLVHDTNFSLGIVPTFGAGTVIVQNRVQRGNQTILGSVQSSEAQIQREKLNAQAIADFEAKAGAPSSPTSSASPRSPQRTSRSYSTTSSARAYASLISTKSGVDLFPLLCLSIHEHAWLQDYGIWGKEEYIRNFWECVNWDKLQNDYSLYRDRS